MKNLFETATVEEVKQRLTRLRSDNDRQWGKMNPAQAVAHCSGAMEMALGMSRLPRVLIGRIAGPFAKWVYLKDEKPFDRNSPTDKTLVINDDRDLEKERQRLSQLIERFAAAGADGCTAHPHPFFGRLTPAEWARLMYKHLDHHLRQFGV